MMRNNWIEETYKKFCSYHKFLLSLLKIKAMKIEHSIINITDMGGMFDITKAHSKFIYQEVTYTYIATGLVREVFRSEDGKSVIKIPKDESRFDHNILEWEVYRDAPEWCKGHIAKTELTKDNYVIQEYVKVNPDAGNFYREVGVRESDGKVVIFDCDIFLDSWMKKPEKGFKYQQVFSKSNAFGEASKEAKELPRKLRLIHREAINQYFPNIRNQEFRSDGQEKTYIDKELVPIEIANKCGFNLKTLPDYD